jgi:hypothetical protein
VEITLAECCAGCSQKQGFSTFPARVKILKWSISRGYAKIPILIEHAAALDIKDIDERTPLDIAGPESEIEELLRESIAKALNS